MPDQTFRLLLWVIHFKDRVDSCREAILKEKGQEVPPDKCFVGFDAYQKVIDAGVDIIITATPPFFRPEILAAAIQAKKHVFAEKPVCVDPVGARSIMATAQKAKGMELCIVTGTQRRHQRDYVATWQQVGRVQLVKLSAAMFTGTVVNFGIATQMHHGAKWNI